MRLGVVCEALTDQDGFVWTTSILDSSCLVIGFSLSGRHKLHYRQSSECERKGAKTVLVTANPAAIHQGFTEVLPAAPFLVVPISIVSLRILPLPHRGRFNLCPFP